MSIFFLVFHILVQCIKFFMGRCIFLHLPLCAKLWIKHTPWLWQFMLLMDVGFLLSWVALNNSLVGYASIFAKYITMSYTFWFIGYVALAEKKNQMVFQSDCANVQSHIQCGRAFVAAGHLINSVTIFWKFSHSGGWVVVPYWQDRSIPKHTVWK